MADNGRSLNHVSSSEGPDCMKRVEDGPSTYESVTLRLNRLDGEAVRNMWLLCTCLIRSKNLQPLPPFGRLEADEVSTKI